MKLNCDLRPIPEYISELDKGKSKSKFGRYHGSTFWDIPEFGLKKWVVGVHIDLDFHQASEMNLNEEEQIVKACVEYLNQPPPRKKYARRSHLPKYGKLDLYHARIISRGDDKYISALLITSERKSKHFWGKGRNVIRSAK